MRKNTELSERQNDETALTLLRASEHCLNSERYVKYLMIFMSFSICLAAIFNRYLPQMFPTVENIADIQEKIATYVNLISGVVLVCGIVLGFYVARMHTEGTALQDRYEAYVFDNAPNYAILRPVSQTLIEVYAKKTRGKSDDVFKNRIYGPDDSPSSVAAQFEYINKEVHSDYKLYIYIQPFFLTIWIGFCILVIIIAVSFNDKFITTLINILIPSLSAISTIASSWHGCRLQMRQLQNLINVIDGIQSMPESKKLLYISDKHNVRLLADGLFDYRVSAFVIPKFLIRRFQKSVKAGYNSVARRSEAAEEVAATRAVSTPADTQRGVKQKTTKPLKPVRQTGAAAGKTVLVKADKKEVVKPQAKPVKRSNPALTKSDGGKTKK